MDPPTSTCSSTSTRSNLPDRSLWSAKTPPTCGSTSLKTSSSLSPSACFQTLTREQLLLARPWPGVSVKNTFVHCDDSNDDSGDGRCLSAPAGMCHVNPACATATFDISDTVAVAVQTDLAVPSASPSNFVGLDAGTQTSDGEKLWKKRQPTIRSPTRKSPTRKSPRRALEVEAADTDTTAEDKQATKKVALAVEEVPAEIREAFRELLDVTNSCVMLFGVPPGHV